MTADLLLDAPAVVESDDDSLCQECWGDFPDDSLRIHEPSDLRLCLDCLYAVQQRADDDRHYRDYRRGC
jgi:hypothetical protein